MRFSVLSSGSKANCTFVECAGKRFLIDCGLSARQVELRLGSLGIAAQSLTAIFITHEHSDHINGVPSVSRKFKLPVFANRRTAEFIEGCFAMEAFESGETISWGPASLHAFSIAHDAVDPVGFVVRGDGQKFGQATDLGKVTPLVRDSLGHCDSLVLESNHDVEMLQTCGYPWELKQRISSSHGHLSNLQAGELLAELWHPDMKHVVLGHLSENSNTPEMALSTVQSVLDQGEHKLSSRLATLLCASVPVCTPLFEVGGGEVRVAAVA